MKINREELLALLQLVDMTQANEIDCEEFLSRVSGYIEKLIGEGASTEGYEEVLHHLQVCPECREEFDALIEAFRDGGVE